MNEKKDRAVGNAAAYVAIIAVIVVIAILVTIVYLTVSNGTFCPVASMTLCGLAVWSATAKRTQ